MAYSNYSQTTMKTIHSPLSLLSIVVTIILTTFHRSHGFITSPSVSKSFLNVRPSPFSRSHSRTCSTPFFLASAQSSSINTPAPPSSVWFQLVIGKEKQGQPGRIKPLPKNIGDLATKVYEEYPDSLQHCDAADLKVYPPSTILTGDGPDQDPYCSDKSLLELLDEFPDLTPKPFQSDYNPCIIVAPPSSKGKF